LTNPVPKQEPPLEQARAPEGDAETERDGLSSISEEELGRLTSLSEDLDALANVQRLRLLHVLTRPHYAEELAVELSMSRQSALKHIAKLQERGFVRAVHGRRQSGPVIEFLVVPSRLFALGVNIGDLGKLEPEGGPAAKFTERTSILQNAEAPSVPPTPELAARSGNLVAVSGPNAGTRFVLGPDRKRWTLGRDEDRDLRVAHDPFVSGRHAEVQLDWQGPMLVDVFSANGTFVNFARLPRGGRVPLRPGDIIGVGHSVFVYQSD
jgi:DNA-binding transcriptional ArsR family regulator